MQRKQVESSNPPPLLSQAILFPRTNEITKKKKNNKITNEIKTVKFVLLHGMVTQKKKKKEAVRQFTLEYREACNSYNVGFFFFFFSGKSNNLTSTKCSCQHKDHSQLTVKMH